MVFILEAYPNFRNNHAYSWYYIVIYGNQIGFVYGTQTVSPFRSLSISRLSSLRSSLTLETFSI